MAWEDTPDSRKLFVADAARLIADSGGIDAMVSAAADAWGYVNAHMHVDPSKLRRAALEQAYTNSMHAAWHLARLSFAVNGSLLDGGDARRYTASKGGNAKAAKDPKAKARQEAARLWPQANRQGWGAPQFYRAICDAGHSIAYETARKWLTKLRKTGEL